MFLYLILRPHLSVISTPIRQIVAHGGVRQGYQGVEASPFHVNISHLVPGTRTSGIEAPGVAQQGYQGVEMSPFLVNI